MAEAESLPELNFGVWIARPRSADRHAIARTADLWEGLRQCSIGLL